MKYYSEELDKLFDTKKELVDAETAAAKEKAEREQKKAELKETRKARAQEIEEARKHYNALIKQFVKDYGSFHYSITGLDSIDEILDSFFKH